jgi:hypothetical protein
MLFLIYFIIYILFSVVKTFGAEAHRNSKDYVAPVEEATTASTTTSTTPSTTEISFFSVVDGAEKRLFQTTVNQTWNPTCYGDSKGKCILIF